MGQQTRGIHVCFVSLYVHEVMGLLSSELAVRRPAIGLEDYRGHA